MDYINFIKQEKTFTVNAPARLFKLFSLASIILLPITNSWAFETNDDSKITAGLEVDGALKAGSVEVQGVLKAGSVDSSSNGIVTSIGDNGDNTTIPTTKAVVDYIQAQISASSSSGGYPTQAYVVGDSYQAFVPNICYIADFGGFNDWRLPTVNEVMNLDPGQTRYIWTTDPGLENNHFMAVWPSGASVVSTLSTNGVIGGYENLHMCVR